MSEELKAEADVSDVIAIGYKVVEMADGVKSVFAVHPNAEGYWRFEMEGVTYELRVAIVPDEQVN